MAHPDNDTNTEAPQAGPPNPPPEAPPRPTENVPEEKPGKDELDKALDANARITILEKGIANTNTTLDQLNQLVSKNQQDIKAGIGELAKAIVESRPTEDMIDKRNAEINTERALRQQMEMVHLLHIGAAHKDNNLPDWIFKRLERPV